MIRGSFVVCERPHHTHSPRRHRRARLIVGGAVGSVMGWLAARRLHRLEVVGDSMRPSLAPGDRVLAVEGLAIRPGDVVAVTDPRGSGRLLVKRVRELSGDSVDVRGDNDAASTDSRSFGPVAAASVRGRVIYRYAPPGRAGRLS